MSRIAIAALLSLALAPSPACRSKKSPPAEDEDIAAGAGQEEDDESPEVEDAGEPEGDGAPAAGDDPMASYRLIPPVVEGSYEEMWGALRDVDEIYTPVMDLELPAKPSLADYATVKWADLRSKQLVIRRTGAGQTSELHVVYTDSALIDSGMPYTPVDPVAFLMWALSDPTADGVFFNPTSRVCDRCDRDRAVGLNGFAVAELIGYLKTDSDDAALPYSELAVQAEKLGDQWQVLSYAGRSFREPRDGDDWKAAELSKLRAYWMLDFPRARTRAIDELEWFIREHGATPEREELLRWFKERR